MSKQFWGVIVVIILIFVGIFALGGNSSKTSGTKGSSSALTNHVEGKGTTHVTLVEYGDYQCPFCGEYYPTVKQVQSEFNDRIIFQFRNFPLVSIHQNAFAGARAAEAAALQGKFWQMHDLLYENQTQWSGGSDPSSFFTQYAQQLRLNVAQFKNDYASSKVNDAVNADMAEGNKLKIDSTPTFILDGKELDVRQLVDSSNQPSVSAFEKLINAEIAKKAKEKH
ncbi:MAG: thioredoxin domain-containing protein [Candidatus Saccharimonadales bacterium]